MISDLDTRDDVLSPGTLARFATGITWPEMLALRSNPKWWRRVILRAEDDGFIRWDKKRRAWFLTEAARPAVRHVA